MIIDISYYNKISDWLQVKDAVDGVIVRMGYTGYGAGKMALDKCYYDNITACELLGIKKGVYYFPQSINADEARSEAFFIKNALPATPIDLGVWLDSEIADVKNKSGRADKLSKQKRSEFLLIIIEELKKMGITAGVYASTSWLNNQLDMVNILRDVPVWVAQYNFKCTYQGSYIMWQYTSKGKVPGIVGNVDMSRVMGSVDNVDIADDELTKAIDVLAHRVIKGQFGEGHEVRKNTIYELIRKRVNDILK